MTQNNDLTGTVVLTNSGANNVSLTNGAALTLGSSTIGQSLFVTAAGNLNVGAITATNVNLTTSGAGNGINFSGAVTAANAITANAAAGNVTLNPGAKLIANGPGAALTLMAGSSSAAGTVTGGDFVNNAGASVLSTPTAGASWLIYTGDLSGSGTVLGGLTVPAWRYDSDISFVPGAGSDEVLYRAAPTLTIAATPQSSTYGSTPTLVATGYTVAGEVSGNGVTVDSQASALKGTPALATTATASSPVAGNPYAITVSVGTITNPYNYQLSFVNGVLTVNPAALTITADNASKTYGQTVTFTGSEFTSTGLQNGESIGSVTLTSAGAPATANVAGSPYAIIPSAATGGTFNAGNYTIGYVNGVLTVNPAALTITADNASKTYGQTVTFTGSEFTSTGLQNGESIGSVTLTSAGAPATANVAGSPYAIIPSAATGGTFNAGNYTIGYVNGVLTVNPAALTITADNASKTYGQTVTFTGSEFTSTGLQNGESIGSVTLTSAGAPATANVAGSPYAIIPSAATGGTFNAGNYTIGYVNGVLTVNPAALTITADNASKTYGQTVTFTGSEFTSTGLQNGESIGSVTLTSAGAPATANVAGSPYAIIPSAATGGTFNAGNYTIGYVNGVLTVNPAALTITADNASKTYGQTVTFTGSEFTSTGLQNGESIGSVTLTSAGAPATANVAGSPYAIIPSAATGGTFNAGNYTIGYVNGVLTVNPAALTITADNASKTYGQTVTFTGSEFTSTGLQNGESIGSVTLTSAGAPATANVAGSPYAIIPSAATGGTFNAGNYTIGYVNGVLTVNPATLTVGLTSTTTKIYDGTTAATLSAGNYTLTGILNGDPVSLNDPANGAYATKNVGTGINVSVAGLQLLGPQAGDYELESTAVSGKIGIITPATLAYVANPAIDSVGTSLPVLAGTVSGFVGGDTLDNSTTGTLAFATTATHASPPGAYAINGSGLVASDYIFVQAPSNATALVLANPTNIGTQPIPVGADPLPIVPPEARNPLDPSGVMQTASANSCRIPSNFDISATLPSAAERIESSAGMGDFAIIYQSDFGNGQESNDKFAGSLSYASSFTAFDSHERPGWCVRRWSRT